ncbi:hypothetical protein V6N11_061885 [Hibiscus sabdariffa]|uniref:Leucine-rich repeat-containing N-terminal plant-type domain-containing protein n=1 Tax=Hibiscus sabdariffa TaxID=183260 RepID=A0ABR2N7J8_9ROSI
MLPIFHKKLRTPVAKLEKDERYTTNHANSVASSLSTFHKCRRIVSSTPSTLMSSVAVLGSENLNHTTHHCRLTSPATMPEFSQAGVKGYPALLYSKLFKDNRGALKSALSLFMICISNIMATADFLPPFMFLLLFSIFRTTLSTNSPNITTDQSALLALKSHITHDPHNLLATNWSTSTSVCNWIGVTCGSRHHRVTALDLSSMDLTGTIPSQLGNLSFLASLKIRNNSFHGSLPIELTNLHRLRHLNFGNNSFNGEIPSWFGYFIRLESLFLYMNNFSGVIPSSLTDLITCFR